MSSINNMNKKPINIVFEIIFNLIKKKYDRCSR